MTLAEMMATLVILATLGFVAQPVVAEIMRMYKLHGATRQVFAEMQKARMSAVMENTRYRSRLVDGTMVMERFDSQTAAWVKISDQDLTYKDTTQLSLSAPASIVFAPSGAAVESGSITLADSLGNRRTIVVSPAGSIRVD